MDEDEAYVETEEDPLVPDTEPESQPPPQMPNLWILWFKHYLSNPWVLIILFLFFYFYVFKKFWPKIQFFFQNHWNDWRAKNEEAKVIADMKKNPDLYRQKIEAMDAIRRRQQETYEAAARLLAEKQALLSIKPILCFVILFRRHRVSASKFFLLFRKSTKFFTMSANQSSTQPGARGMEATDPSQGAAAQPPHIPSQSVIQQLEQKIREKEIMRDGDWTRAEIVKAKVDKWEEFLTEKKIPFPKMGFDKF